MAEIGNDRGFLTGCLISAVAVPVLSIGLGLPFLLAIPVAICAGAGAGLLLRRRGRTDRFDVRRFGEGQAELVRSVVAEAETSIGTIREAARRAGEDGAVLDDMARQATTILDRLVENPSAMSEVRRFLAYYLPQAAQIASAWATLITRGVSEPDRLTSMRVTIGRLDEAFRLFARTMAESDLGPIEIQMNLLNQSLDQDFRIPLGSTAPAATKEQRP